MTKILVADDSRFHLALLKNALEERGFQILLAEDALHTTMVANRAQPDAIVLDLSMPGGSGVEVLTRIKRSARTKSIPVVVVTANEDAGAKEKVISLGASEFLQKPIDLDELATRLSNLLKTPNSGKQRTESYAAASPPTFAGSEGFSSKSPPKASRSWRQILHEIATENLK